MQAISRVHRARVNYCVRSIIDASKKVGLKKLALGLETLIKYQHFLFIIVDKKHWVAFLHIRFMIGDTQNPLKSRLEIAIDASAQYYKSGRPHNDLLYNAIYTRKEISSRKFYPGCIKQEWLIENITEGIKQAKLMCTSTDTFAPSGTIAEGIFILQTGQAGNGIAFAKFNHLYNLQSLQLNLANQP